MLFIIINILWPDNIQIGHILLHIIINAPD